MEFQEQGDSKSSNKTGDEAVSRLQNSKGTALNPVEMGQPIDKAPATCTSNHLTYLTNYLFETISLIGMVFDRNRTIFTLL